MGDGRSVESWTFDLNIFAKHCFKNTNRNYQYLQEPLQKNNPKWLIISRLATLPVSQSLQCVVLGEGTGNQSTKHKKADVKIKMYEITNALNFV